MNKIAFIGAGAMGGILGSFLNKGGAEVWFIDPYKEHMDAIRDNGLHLTLNDEEVYVDGFKTAYDTTGVPEMDVIFIMLNSNLSHIAIAEALEISGPDTCVISCQNGLGHPQEMAEQIPANRVLYGTIWPGGRLIGPGHVFGNTAVGVNVHIGALERNDVTNAHAQFLVDTFEAGGLGASYDEDIDAKVWNKVLLNCVVNATCALTRLTMGSLYYDPSGNGKIIMEKVAREVGAVAAAKGIDLGTEDWINNFLPGHMKKIYEHHPSMSQDLYMREKKTEIDWLNAKVWEYGQELGVPTPYNEVITVFIRAIQANYEHQWKPGK